MNMKIDYLLTSIHFMFVQMINKWILIVVEHLQISYVYEMKLKGSNNKYQW